MRRRPILTALVRPARRRAPRVLLAAALACAAAGAAHAQDLEPRRWSHQPVGTNVGGLSYAYTDGDLQFDPVLEISGATVESHTVVAGYSRWFAMGETTARFDAILPYGHSRWEGLLSGAPASVSREGFGDPWVRLSVNLVGAPAVDAQGYREYHAGERVHTVAGVALGVKLPLGQYDKDRLLNIGANRFVFRPQAGVVHRRGPWSYELTGSAFLYTDNTDFFGGRTLSQDPMGALQGHVVRTFPNRMWASASAGYSWGGETRVDGVSKDDSRSYVLSALSVGMPVGDSQALKVVYTRGDTKQLVGVDANTLVVSWSLRF